LACCARPAKSVGAGKTGASLVNKGEGLVSRLPPKLPKDENVDDRVELTLLVNREEGLNPKLSPKDKEVDDSNEFDLTLEETTGDWRWFMVNDGALRNPEDDEAGECFGGTKVTVDCNPLCVKLTLEDVFNLVANTCFCVVVGWCEDGNNFMLGEWRFGTLLTVANRLSDGMLDCFKVEDTSTVLEV